ncbi:MAG: sigma-54 dependent transcriptional regulator [Nitrospiraceae bacterium]|nr:sigma-54 dependent transcriptional regulator [Nitrospiraceae bacterium]
MQTRILIVDDEKDILRALEFLFKADGHAVTTALSGEKALSVLQAESFDIMISDLKMPGMDGLKLLEEAKRLYPDMTVVMMSAYATVEGAVDAMKKGAADYIVKPFMNDDVRFTVRRLIEEEKLRSENRALRQELSQHRSQHKRSCNEKIIFISDAMTQVFEMLNIVTPTKGNILLTGESGTGKGLIALLIHCNSPRSNGPFISINCSAIPEGLLESELFGYRRGAFTGASVDKKGLIELANEGTLFLDEIGDMAPALQAKLLTVLEAGEVMPLGDTRKRSVDLRLVCATNRDLEKSITEGGFREDLYYRLAVFEIRVPALRERAEDISVLTDFFIKKYSEENGRTARGISQGAREALASYRWPGNVRELSNVIERAVVLASGNMVGTEHLPDKVRFQRHENGCCLRDVMSDYEKNVIIRAYNLNNKNKETTARYLGIDLVTLYRKMKKLGIEE